MHIASSHAPGYAASMHRLLPLLFLLCAYPAARVQAQEIHRCVAPDGQTLFTDRRCEDVGAASRAPPAIRPQGNTGLYRYGCPRRLSELVSLLQLAVDSRDVNRLSSLYLWERSIRCRRQSSTEPPGSHRAAPVAGHRADVSAKRHPELGRGHHHAHTVAGWQCHRCAAPHPAQPPAPLGTTAGTEPCQRHAGAQRAAPAQAIQLLLGDVLATYAWHPAARDHRRTAARRGS